MKRVYISGPITGIPDLNKPAFDRAAIDLRAQGHYPMNPLDINHVNTPYVLAMKNDIRMLMECDAIYLLPGWEASKGASLERHIAEVLGLEII